MSHKYILLHKMIVGNIQHEAVVCLQRVKRKNNI